MEEEKEEGIGVRETDRGSRGARPRQLKRVMEGGREGSKEVRKEGRREGSELECEATCHLVWFT